MRCHRENVWLGHIQCGECNLLRFVRDFVEKNRQLNFYRSGKPKSSKCLSMLGRLSAISEPFKNGPEHMLILRIAHTSDSSTFCHLLTQVCQSLSFRSQIYSFVLFSV